MGSFEHRALTHSLMMMSTFSGRSMLSMVPWMTSITLFSCTDMHQQQQVIITAQHSKQHRSIP